jgi:EAL domain-containing protein (putative c-di-GMP-specific phosphodiesterase class I)
LRALNREGQVMEELEFEQWLEARDNTSAWLIASIWFVGTGRLGHLLYPMRLHSFRSQIMKALTMPSCAFANRIENGRYVVVLRDTPENAATLDALRRRMHSFLVVNDDGREILTPTQTQVLRLPPHSSTTASAILSTLVTLGVAQRESPDQMAEVYEFDLASQAAFRAAAVRTEYVRNHLSADFLELVAQPVRATQRLEADPEPVEILSRIKTHTGETIYPNEFLPIARACALSVYWDRCVATRAINWYARTLAQNTHAPSQIALNFSAETLTDSATTLFLRDEITRHKLDPARICIELTESSGLSNLDVAQAAVRSLKSLGVRVSIDDFGTGFATYTYLRALAVDQIKIDGSFVTGLSSAPSLNEEIIGSIVRIAKLLDIETVAEHVECEHEMLALRRLGVDRLQGYFLSRPVAIV